MELCDSPTFRKTSRSLPFPSLKTSSITCAQNRSVMEGVISCSRNPLVSISLAPNQHLTSSACSLSSADIAAHSFRTGCMYRSTDKGYIDDLGFRIILLDIHYSIISSLTSNLISSTSSVSSSTSTSSPVSANLGTLTSLTRSPFGPSITRVPKAG